MISEPSFRKGSSCFVRSSDFSRQMYYRIVLKKFCCKIGVFKKLALTRLESDTNNMVFCIIWSDLYHVPNYLYFTRRWNTCVLCTVAPQCTKSKRKIPEWTQDFWMEDVNLSVFFVNFLWINESESCLLKIIFVT